MIQKISKIVIAITLIFIANVSKAQMAMQINGQDCNGTSHDMFSELNAGKAVVVFFFMPNCGTCPPVALKIQTMVNNILVSHPNMVTAYAMPFNNTTTCTYTNTWVATNGLSLYSPYDSGAVQVANYGGFGMPTVVLLGGTNHRVMFSTLSFATSDTTTMRDSILNLFAPLAINDIPSNINAINVYPNPSNANATITIDVKESVALKVELLDITGKQIAILTDEKNVSGQFKKEFTTANLSNGFYTIRINANGKIATQKLNVTH